MSDEMHIVYLGLGTNLGDKTENIQTAIKYLEERVGRLKVCSSFLVTEPFGFESENQFLNAVCSVRTIHSAIDVLTLTQEIEREMGRTHKSVNKVYSDRIIDIDLLLYDDLVLETETLILPHPHLHERNFVLGPLKEIAPDYFHPVLRKNICDL